MGVGFMVHRGLQEQTAESARFSFVAAVLALTSRRRHTSIAFSHIYALLSSMPARGRQAQGLCAAQTDIGSRLVASGATSGWEENGVPFFRAPALAAELVQLRALRPRKFGDTPAHQTPGRPRDGRIVLVAVGFVLCAGVSLSLRDCVVLFSVESKCCLLACCD